MMNIEKCQNPDACKVKHSKWKKHQEKSTITGDKKHENFLECLEDGCGRLEYHSHFENKRSFERVVSHKAIREIVTYGWVIEHRYLAHAGSYRVTLMGYTSQRRALHVVCEVISKNEWEVITAYSPTSQPWKWSSNFQERVCFCK